MADARRFSREHDLIPIRVTDPGGATLPDVGLWHSLIRRPVLGGF
ncbi:MAG: hypothetical protein CM1200mP14_02440 [Gammaproteobacteria bacterium]|nr:MAG: hypothetical protein CM1200mP14_02440 [Gammaproteobacteria bacterium]